MSYEKRPWKLGKLAPKKNEEEKERIVSQLSNFQEVVLVIQ